MPFSLFLLAHISISSRKPSLIPLKQTELFFFWLPLPSVYVMNITLPLCGFSPHHSPELRLIRGKKLVFIFVSLTPQRQYVWYI